MPLIYITARKSQIEYSKKIKKSCGSFFRHHKPGFFFPFPLVNRFFTAYINIIESSDQSKTGSFMKQDHRYNLWYPDRMRLPVILALTAAADFLLYGPFVGVHSADRPVSAADLCSSAGTPELSLPSRPDPLVYPARTLCRRDFPVRRSIPRSAWILFTSAVPRRLPGRTGGHLRSALDPECAHSCFFPAVRRFLSAP